MTGKQYFQIAKAVHDLIASYIQHFQKNEEELPQVYPKFILTLEFLRLLRGNFFRARPLSSLDYQRQIHAMEVDIQEQLKDIERKLDLKDSRTQYYLQEKANIFKR